MSTDKIQRQVILGAIFLMGLSAIGPGFLTQTVVFTLDLGTTAAFVILMSILLDIVVQLNIWRIIIVSGKRAQEIASEVLPGLGYWVSGIVVFGGLAFNIGNIAGAGLGLEALTGISVKTGALVSAVMAIGIFLFKKAASIMDKFVIFAGVLLLSLITFMLFKTEPPYREALYKSVMPGGLNKGLFLAIITLVGGTVGGYIPFSGAHRLLDGRVKGREFIRPVTIASLSGIGITAMVRGFLFLAILGVAGMVIPKDAGIAEVFGVAGGSVGKAVFGMVMWAAASTSVVGAAYTSVTFLKSFHPFFTEKQNLAIILMIAISCLLFILIGRPVKILVFAGTLNGIVLPMTLAPLLVAAYRKSIVGDYKHPRVFSILGWIVVALMAVLSVYTFYRYFTA